MKKPHKHLRLAALTLGITPVAVLSAMSSGSTMVLSVAALAAMLAGVAFALIATDVLKKWY